MLRRPPAATLRWPRLGLFLLRPGGGNLLIEGGGLGPLFRLGRGQLRCLRLHRACRRLEPGLFLAQRHRFLAKLSGEATQHQHTAQRLLRLCRTASSVSAGNSDSRSISGSSGCIVSAWASRLACACRRCAASCVHARGGSAVAASA